MINVKTEYYSLEEALHDIEADHMHFAEALQQIAQSLGLAIDIPPPFTKNVEVDLNDIQSVYDYVMANYRWHQYINEAIRIIGDHLIPPVIVSPKILFSTQVDEFLIFERIMHLDIDSFLANL
ncbi:MAG: hypothetical protein QXT86_11435 [Archaeoglobaceae archaeon]